MKSLELFVKPCTYRIVGETPYPILQTANPTMSLVFELVDAAALLGYYTVACLNGGVD